MLSVVLATYADKTLKVVVTNPMSQPRENVPVTVDIDDDDNVCSALVMLDGKEIPCQLDDFDDDGEYDELCFLTDMKKKEKQTFTVTLYTQGEPRKYESRVYGSISLRDRSAKNPKHLPMRSLTVPASSNPYQYVFPHGPLLESELVGYRIYCDHRQAVDFYGHKTKQLELAETAFYPSKEQKAGKYGDDVLYTGTTYGCGTMHGWNGTTSVMYENVRSKQYTLVAQGPVRTIIETVNRGWQPSGCYQGTMEKPVNVRTRYILYAGHRDVLVDVKFSRDVPDITLSTGVTDIVGSEELTGKNGLLGCWGTACAGNNPKVYDTHTVGLAVCVPEKYYKGDSRFTDGKETLPNQAYVAVMGTSGDDLHYWFAATCDIENQSENDPHFGFADSKAWYAWMKDWKKQNDNPVRVSVSD